ncbi:MAG: hypothetical protein Kow0062_21100 [Acidobacteriota bacterium]
MSFRLPRAAVRLVPVLAVLLVAVAATFAAPPAQAVWVDPGHGVRIDPSRGADPRVDYAALVHYGPWDDRNYRLTAEDIALLAPNEAELRAPIPAWFRVALRRANPELARNPAVRYPLSAYNAFRQNHGGYLIDGRYYRRAFRRDGRYWVDLEAPATPGPQAPASDALSGEVRVTSPNGAAESAIAISPADTNRVVAGTNGPSGGQKMHWSADGGATWTQVTLPLGGDCCDPTVEWSSDGQYAYTATLGACIFFCQLWFYRSDDGGQTWTSLEDVTPGDPRREISTNADREYMHVDHSPDSPFRDRIYITYHENNVMQVARSADFGHSWLVFTLSGASENRGIAGDIVTDRQGKVYLIWPAFNSRTIRLSTSTNGGATFGPISVIASTNASFTFPIPAMNAREVSVYVSADADMSGGPFDGSIYAAWADATAPPTGNPSSNHARVQVAYSRDGGASWTVTTPHETADSLSVDRFQPFLAVGPDGTVHVIFHDTRRSPDRSGSDLFYSFSTDGAQTWSAPRRITTEISPSIEDGFEYGDYSGLDMVMNDLIAIFTDNRNETGGAADSVDVYAAGIEPGGSGSPGAGRIPGAKDVPGQPLTLDKSGADIVLEWSPVCGAGTDYAVYEGLLGDPASSEPRQCSTGGATTTTLTPSSGQRFYLVVAQTGSNEGSYGQDSTGTERTPSVNACLPQAIGACP